MPNHAIQLHNLDKYNGQHITRKSAIRLKCLDCCGNQQNEVRLCPATDCPLWGYRMAQPWQDPAEGPPVS